MDSKMHPVSLGLAFGIALGVIAMVLAYVSMMFGVSMHVADALRGFVGFDLSYVGGAIGLAKGILDGFVFGFVAAHIYNFVLRYRR